MRRAKALSAPKRAIFIHLCKTCKEHQKERKDKQILYQTDRGDCCFLMIELCAKCMNRNEKLAESYATLFG
jgi:hypothetical protein